MARKAYRTRSSFPLYPASTSAEEKVARAVRAAAALAKSGTKLSPVRLAGKAIATTVWGKAWCTNLEGYSDYANRLPRGRSYLRTGAVLDLAIEAGRVAAVVQGSRRYDVKIEIAPVAAATWENIVATSAGRIGSLLEILQGDLPAEVLRAVTAPGSGLFPEPRELALACSCPDWATMCKHVAAVLYGVGARLDAEPELLFTLRRADASALVAGAVTRAVRADHAPGKRLEGDLASLFGIELEPEAAPAPARVAPPQPAAKPALAPTPPAKRVRAARAPKPISWTRKELGLLGVSSATVDRWVRRGLLVAGAKAGALVETPPVRALVAAYGRRASSR